MLKVALSRRNSMWMKKNVLKVLSLAIVLALAGPSLSWAQGVVEDKDTIEKRGPGGLDVPTETAPTPSPSAEEKSASDQMNKAEKKAEKSENKDTEKK